MPIKIGVRQPSLKKRVSARTSVKRMVRHRAGLKAPRGYGWFTNPHKAAYNRVYRRTTIGCVTLPALLLVVVLALVYLSP
jgi:hypothetical protein